MQKTTIGILGGMGPQATCDLFQKIIKRTPAARDQDHLHIVIDNNPQVPDRTAFLIGQGPDPTDELVEGARRLARVGCSFILIPCNTAHYFTAVIEQAADVPVLSMIDNVAAVAQQLLPAGSAVGIMATTGTVQSELYHQSLRQAGLLPLSPDDVDQAEVMDIIYGPAGVKAGYDGPELRARARLVADRLIARGAQAIVAGCTEIPLVLQDGDVSVPVLDATDLLAAAAVNRARTANQ